MNAWQIDALDPRAGLAFVSWRSFSLNDEDRYLREAPCVLISAPYFRSEPLATRTLARAAHRGPFQTGFFIGEQEVRFKDLDAVSELVRRIYLSSGGGDGFEGTPPTIPPSPDGGPDIPPIGPAVELLREREESYRAETSELYVNILQRVMQFRDMTPPMSELAVSGVGFEWRTEHAQPRPASEATKLIAPSIGRIRRASDILGWAALLLMHEMLQRLPPQHLYEQLHDWMHASTHLGNILTHLDLWDWVFDDNRLHLFASWADALRKSATLPFSAHVTERFEYLGARISVPYLFLSVFGQASLNADDDIWFEWLRFSGSRRAIMLLFRSRSPNFMADPIQGLRLIPLPRTLSGVVSPYSRNITSLMHLLASASASPTTLLEDGTFGENATAMLIFIASAVLLNGGEESRALAPFDTFSETTSPLQVYRFEKVVANAWAWLAGSLPRILFPAPLEEAINSASALRYRGYDPEASLT